MSPAPRNAILVGDALQQLRRLASAYVDCVITSPPYYQLRDYGVDGQLGLEPHVDNWVDGLVTVLQEVARVLKPTGSVWLNLGDSYSTHARYGAPPKGLLLAPERLLLALADNGWVVRNKVIWAKPNPMPHSVADRLNTSYEVVYFLVRSRRYYFDLDAIRVPHRSKASRKRQQPESQPREWVGPLADQNEGLRRSRAAGQPGHLLGKNPGDVWWLATRPYRSAHFATFPPGLVERPLLATCPERICVACGTPWRRPAEKIRLPAGGSDDTHVYRFATQYQVARRLGPLGPDCDCGAAWTPGVVLDPFFGTGTVGAVAVQHRRHWLGIELNPVYAELARQRVDQARAELERAA